jgi:1-acyl-sn-glycerol-3-phosphate acyltransferase
MQIIKKIAKFLFTIYIFILFVAFLLLIFPLVIVASFFGKVKGGNFIYKLCKTWSSFILFMAGIKITYSYEAPTNFNTQYVYVFNHISYIDIPVLVKAVQKQNFRVLGKAELAKVPIFGFLYRNTVVTVDRSSTENRAKSVLQLKSIIAKGISIVISPEGTFNMTHQPLSEFYDGAFKIAIETQTPIKPMLFLDAYDRLSYKSIFSLTPGKCRVVYLQEVSVNGLTKNDVQLLKENVYQKMEEALINYKASWIGE